MSRLSELELSNWVAIYSAVGVCCALAVALSAAAAAREIYRDRSWARIRDIRSAMLFIPQTWWRWQKLYLLTTPVTLGIALAFASTLRWS